MTKQLHLLTSAIWISSFMLRLLTSQPLKLFSTSGVFVTYNDSSLLKSSVFYDVTPRAFSFNYNYHIQQCELGNDYPESTTTVFGWKVCAHIVNGVWGNWMNWDTCSVTCGDWTRTRTRSCDNPSPSNGGEFCQRSNVDIQNCKKDCNGFVNGYFLSEDTKSWDSAKTTCEAMSSMLVMFDSQQDINELMVTFDRQGLNHWIGMTCSIGKDCKWLDGRAAVSGFKAWAPNEPNGADCIG